MVKCDPQCLSRFTENIQNSLTLSYLQEAVADTPLPQPVEALLGAPQITDVIQKGVNTFMESVPSLIKVLEEVAEIHPFISGRLRPFNERIKVCVIGESVQWQSSHLRPFTRSR